VAWASSTSGSCASTNNQVCIQLPEQRHANTSVAGEAHALDHRVGAEDAPQRVAGIGAFVDD
jgi:hypothetical protein